MKKLVPSGLPTEKTNHTYTDKPGSAGRLCKLPGPLSSRIGTTNYRTARNLCSSRWYRNTYMFPTDLSYPAPQHQITNNRFTGNFRDDTQQTFPPAQWLRHAFLDNTSRNKQQSLIPDRNPPARIDASQRKRLPNRGHGITKSSSQTITRTLTIKKLFFRVLYVNSRSPEGAVLCTNEHI